MLEIDGLTVRYPSVVALDDVTCRAPAGSIVAVVGPNGAGKSTLLRAVAGLDLGPRCERVGAVAIDCHRPRQAGKLPTAYCPDSTLGFLDLTASENLELLLRSLGTQSDERLRRMEVALKLLRLDDAVHRRLSELSLGMRKRTDVVLTVCRDAEVYLFDEPYNGLDAAWIRTFSAILDRLAAARRIAVIASHAVDVLLAEANVVWELDCGGIVQQLSAERRAFRSGDLLHTHAGGELDVSLPWLGI